MKLWSHVNSGQDRFGNKQIIFTLYLEIDGKQCNTCHLLDDDKYFTDPDWLMTTLPIMVKALITHWESLREKA